MVSSTTPVDCRCPHCQRRESPIFSNLSCTAFEYFERLGEHRTRPENSIVFREGATPDGVYMVCGGEVKLSTTSPKGRTMILKVAGLGEILGLSATLNLQPYEATAMTRRRSSLKHIGRNEFLKFMRTHAEAGVNVASMIATEYRDILRGARRLALLSSASARMAQILIDFSKSAPRPGSAFPMSLTHEELASIAGTSRETVTRQLNQFERDGLISREGSAITVLRSPDLHNLVQ
ncbi:MAG TPA: Crp/Fnr family transcriptional regulator [Rhodanobacter sp.]|nr:Crp/Fnr family transcriptional regulator [Rhodanobacter sp.]